MSLTLNSITTHVSENTGNLFTATHATAGTNRGLLVFIGNSSQANPHAVRYGGVAMSLEVAAQEAATGKRMTIWSLPAPPTGSNTLAISYSAAVAAAMTVVSLIDADQTDMCSTVQSNTGATNLPTLNFTSTSTEVVFDGLVWAGTTAAVGAQQTQRSNHVTSGGSIRNATSNELGSAVVTMSWNLGATADWALCAVSVKQAAADTISQGPTNTQVSIYAVTNVNTDNTGTAYSFAVDTSGTDRAVVVLISNTTQALPHGVTYGANALTQEGYTQEVPTGRYISIWSLIAPSAGSNTLIVSFSAAAAAAFTVFSLTHANQFDVIGGYLGGAGTSTTPGTPLSAGAGDLIIDGLSFDTGNASPTGTDQTLRSHHGNSAALIATSSKPGTGAVTMSWSLSNTDDWALGAVNVKPAVGLEGRASMSHIMLNLSGRRGMREHDFYTWQQEPLSDEGTGDTTHTPSNTGSVGGRISLPPPTLANDEQWKRQAEAWMREANQGRIANTGVVTLQAGAASTTVQDDRVGQDSFIGLMPRTANAATEYGSGALYVITGKQTFTIAHTNNAQTDRTFIYSIMG